jgi:hypothetical protein
VENKVGTHRRNMFVPVPAVGDAEPFNSRLLQQSLALSDGKPHWKKGTPKGQGGPLGARAAEVLLQEVGDEEVQQARHVHARRHTALLRRPRLGRKGGGGLLRRLPCGDLRSEDGR